MDCGVRRRAPGLRIKTENKGFAGSRAQTAPVLQREKRKTPDSGLQGAKRKPCRQEKAAAFR